MTIEVHPATTDRFEDVTAILGPRNASGSGCWCLYFRLSVADFNALRGEERPAYLRKLCGGETAPGMLAYVDGTPAGWCAIGPRAQMDRLRRSRKIPQVDDLPVWSMVCFVVRAGYRRKGVARALLRGTIAYARQKGAVMLESYPVDTGGRRISGTFAYVGTVSLFESEGFQRVLETEARSGGLPRWIMRLPLT